MTIDELNQPSKSEHYPETRPVPTLPRPVYMAEGGSLGPEGMPGAGGKMGGGFKDTSGETSAEAVAKLTPPGGFASIPDLDNAVIKVVNAEVIRRGMNPSLDETKKWKSENLARIRAENAHRVLGAKDYQEIWKEYDGLMVNMPSLASGKPQTYRIGPAKERSYKPEELKLKEKEIEIKRDEATSRDNERRARVNRISDDLKLDAIERSEVHGIEENISSLLREAGIARGKFNEAEAVGLTQQATELQNQLRGIYSKARERLKPTAPTTTTEPAPGANAPKVELSKDEQALRWAEANPNDPDAAKIIARAKKRLGK